MPRVPLEGTSDVYFAKADDIMWLADALNRLKAKYGADEGVSIVRDAISYAIRAEGKATGAAMIRYLTKNYRHVVGGRAIVRVEKPYPIKAVLDSLS